MGNSPPIAEDDDDFAEFDGIETLGYRVLGVQPQSPASKAGLVSFFDFIVGANEEMLLGSGENLEEGEEYNDIDFPKLLRDNKGKTVDLLVWNIKAQEKREVQLVPNDNWPGAGLLGVTIRLDDYGGADERLIRVLEVEENSPASIAGLVPMQDYLLGTTAVSFESTAALASVLQQYCDIVAEIYVYNSESDIVRVVSLMPTLSWGNGSGLLGAEVGVGYLHRLPNHCRDTIGQSVERKVRYKEEQKDDVIEPTAVMEYHLEMEVQGDQKPDDISKQPHELGKSVEGSNKTTFQLDVQLKEEPGKEEPEPEAVPHTTPLENASFASKLPTNPTIPPKNPTEIVGILKASPEEAENFFAGTPPSMVTDSSKSEEETGVGQKYQSQSYSSHLPNLPSPPKMHY